MSDNRTSKISKIAKLKTLCDELDSMTKELDGELQGQRTEIEQLKLTLENERSAHVKTKAERDATTQKLNNALDDVANHKKRLRDAEAKIEAAPRAVAEEWLEELRKINLIGSLDRVISGEAESDPADFRKRLVTWFGRRVNAKPEEVIAVGRQFVEKDSKAAAQIAWSPDTPFRDDVDAVEVEITYAGLRFGEQVVERPRARVMEVIRKPAEAVVEPVVEAKPTEVFADKSAVEAETATPVSDSTVSDSTVEQQPAIESTPPVRETLEVVEEVPTEHTDSGGTRIGDSPVSHSETDSAEAHSIQNYTAAPTAQIIAEPNVHVQHFEATIESFPEETNTNGERLDVDDHGFDQLMNSVEKSEIEFSFNQKTAVRVWIRICTGRTEGMKKDAANMHRNGSYHQELLKLREQYSEKYGKCLKRLYLHTCAYFESHWPGPQ
jgi:hypothetical protein